MNIDKNPEKIKAMFDEISSYYDVMNNIISFGFHYIIKYLSVRSLNLAPRSMILDLCCGTGDFVNIISKFYPRTKVIGLDFSPQMIKIAKIKNPKGTFIQGDCTNLPFKDNEFDYITIGFGLRNIENRQQAIKEIYRVLDKGGSFLHLDFGEQNLISKIFEISLPIFAKLYGKNTQHYKYLLKSKQEFPQPKELAKELEQYGLKCKKISYYLFKTISSQIFIK